MFGVGERTVVAVMLITAVALILGDTSKALGQQISHRNPASKPPIAVEKPRPGPGVSGARFFTINEVLQQRDLVRPGTGAPATIRIASIDIARLRGSLADMPAVAHAVPPKAGPFGTSTFRAPEGLLWVKWRKLEEEMRRDAAIIAQCRSEPLRCPTSEARRVSSLVEAAEAQGGRARLEEANRSVNVSIQYMSDFAQHGVPDLWSSTLASFSSGRGDCEDYAVAKYSILRAAGVPEADLRIMLVKDMFAREAHAVLAAQVNGKWLILDNRRSEISEDREISYLAPLFALDHRGVSLLAQPYAGASRVRETSSADAVVASQSDPSSVDGASNPSLVRATW